jgi:hypothetical protein
MIARITSRKYYNFNNDAHRGGDTIKPFNDKQGWDLLMKLLGEEWQELDRRGLIVVSERNAAKELLTSLGGVSRPIAQVSFLELIQENSSHLQFNKRRSLSKTRKSVDQQFSPR